MIKTGTGNRFSLKPEEVNQAIREELDKTPGLLLNQLLSLHFVKHPENPVLPFGSAGQWDENDVEAGDSIFLGEDGKFWMYYHASGPKKFQIGLAYSNDLVNWTREANNPILTLGGSSEWDEGIVANAQVLKVSNTYHMWYGGMNGGLTAGGVGHATSFDGKTWTKDTCNPLITGYREIWPSSILYVDGYYWLYASVRLTSSDPYLVYLFKSTDGISWEAYSGNPLFQNLLAPQQWAQVGWLNVIKIGRFWLGAVELEDIRLPREGRYHSSLAYSLDGVNWAIRPMSILHQNKQGWDGERICLPTLFMWHNKLYLFYTAGVSGSCAEQIGLAEAVIPGETVEDYFRDSSGVWNAKSISADANTDGIPILAPLTIFFLSDTAGTLSVQVQEPDGNWHTADTVSIAANTLEVYTPTWKARGIRLSFDTAAIVTAWYRMGGE